MAVIRRRGSTVARGYGHDHRRRRAQWVPLVKAGGVRCWRCGHPIVHDPRLIGGGWDLGHDDEDRSRYRGPEHLKCNRGAGARRGNRSPLRRFRRSTPAAAPTRKVTDLRW